MMLGNLNTNKGWDQIDREMREEFRKWDIADYHLPYRRESLSLGSVTVMVKVGDEERQLTCSRFDDGNWPERNYLAIVLAVRAARIADQRGLGALFADAAQLISLPDPNDPWHILGVAATAEETEVLRAYRRKVREVHPDQGGSREELDRVVEAGRKLGMA